MYGRARTIPTLLNPTPPQSTALISPAVFYWYFLHIYSSRWTLKLFVQVPRKHFWNFDWNYFNFGENLHFLYNIESSAPETHVLSSYLLNYLPCSSVELYSFLNISPVHSWLNLFLGISYNFFVVIVRGLFPPVYFLFLLSILKKKKL